MSRRKLFESIARYSTTHPWKVLAIALLAAGLSLAGAARFLSVRTSNLDLISADMPTVKAFLDFADEFGTPNVLVIVLEGDDPATLGAAVDQLEPMLRSIPGVRSAVGKIPVDPARLSRAGVDPYLASRDRGMYMIYVQPEDTRTQVDALAPVLSAVREVLAKAGLEARGIKAGLTGIPQYALDDRDVIQKDISTLSLVSFGLVGVLFFAAFAAMRMPLLAMVTLGFGVVLTVGLITMYPGHLTLLSAFFASILFGLGIDYGIHIINRAGEFMREGLPEKESIVKGVAILAPELTTGAITTSIVFAAMMVSGFRGFAELGFIAACGVLICLLMMISVLPALLALLPQRGARRHEARGDIIGRVLVRIQHPLAALVLGIGGAALSLMGGPGFDGNYMNLQPVDSEAVRLERELVERSNFSPQFAVFTCDTKAEAVDLADRLLDEETVGEVRSIADLEMIAPVDGDSSAWPASFVRGFRSESNRYAVYVYPLANVWEPAAQDAFVAAMKRYDPHVTGMPVLGKFMIHHSERALFITGTIGGVLLLVCVYLNFRRVLPTVITVIPTFLTVAGMHGVMKLLSLPFNSINIMALPVILGIAVDNGVHIVHRFIAEKGDVARVLGGSGRSVVLTSLTTIAAFGSLAFTRHRGLASFAIVLVIGVTLALLLSVLLLPWLLKLLTGKLVDDR